MKTTAKIIAVTALLAIPLSALAAPGRGGHRRPPAEAIEVCEELSAEDACSFTVDGGETITGVCKAGPREDLPLACMPDEPRRED